jgi:hypothetical protein
MERLPIVDSRLISTIDVPLIWKVREIIFLPGKTHKGAVRGDR